MNSIGSLLIFVCVTSGSILTVVDGFLKKREKSEVSSVVGKEVVKLMPYHVWSAFDVATARHGTLSTLERKYRSNFSGARRLVSENDAADVKQPSVDSSLGLDIAQ